MDLLLVGKASVCSLADEQTTASERGMNGETVVFRRSVCSRNLEIYSAFMLIYFLLLKQQDDLRLKANSGLKGYWLLILMVIGYCLLVIES